MEQRAIVFLIRTLWEAEYTNPHLPPPKDVRLLILEAHECYSSLERDFVNVIKGTVLEVGKLSWIVQVDPILHEPLNIKESFLAAAGRARGREPGANDV